MDSNDKRSQKKMTIIFPHDNGSRIIEMDLITVDENRTKCWNLEGMGYPYKYFKRR